MIFSYQSNKISLEREDNKNMNNIYYQIRISESEYILISDNNEESRLFQILSYLSYNLDIDISKISSIIKRDIEKIKNDNMIDNYEIINID